MSLTALLAAHPERVHVVEPTNVLAGGAEAADVVVYDATRTHDDKDEACLRTVVATVDVPVVAVASPRRPDLAARAVNAGVDGVVYTTVTAPELVGVLTELAGRRHDVDDDGATQSLRDRTGSVDRPRDDPEAGLPERRPARPSGEGSTQPHDHSGGSSGDLERSVTELLITGRCNSEIAEELGVSAAAVRTTLRLAYRRAGVTTRSQLVAWTLRRPAA